ncbi:MAG: endonuclease/exonuclease/phosphatase family protein [Anaerolineales bacterium]
MSGILIFTVFSLFFFQLLADFVHFLFAFGLLGTSIPPEIVCVLFLFTPVILFAFRKRIPRGWILLSGFVVLGARVIEPLLYTRGRMLVSGCGLGALLFFFPAYIWFQTQRGDRRRSRDLAMGLMLGVALSILFRSVGSGIDISTRSWSQAIGWGLALGAGFLLLRDVLLSEVEGPEAEIQSRSALTAVSLGWMAVVTTLYFAFTAPNVLSRWTGADYPLIVLGLAVVLTAFAAFYTLVPRFRGFFTPTSIVIGNLGFGLAMTLTILPHQLPFSDQPGAYPFFEPTVPFAAMIPLILMVLFFPILFVDVELCSQVLLKRKVRPSALGGSFSLVSGFLLVMIFGHVFTTVYDYIPVVGPFFRDKFWALHLLLGLLLALTAWVVVGKARLAQEANTKKYPPAVLALGLISLGSIAGVFWPRPSAVLPDEPRSGLRVMTYNIQQGFSEEGELNMDGQLALIQAWDPDLIGLQESDTNRISGGNDDLVRYYADQLGMYAYYGPKVVTGTFGLALLSKYPIESPQTFFMYSEGEQTATIHAEVEVGGERLRVFVTHLGNGGPIIQQRQILGEVEGTERAIAMGDFNFRPQSDQYALTTERLDDAWVEKWPEGEDDRGVRLEDRIDYVFLTPDLKVEDARYLLEPASDHPALVVDVTW